MTMNICKNNWHYKVWAWTYTTNDLNIMEWEGTSINLCPYVRRVVLIAPFKALGFGLLYLLSVVYRQIILLPMLCIGFRPVNLFVNPKDFLDAVWFKRYNGLNVSWSSFKFYLWHFILPTLIGILHYFAITHHWWIFLLIEAVSLVVIGLGVLIASLGYSNNKTVLLYRSWWQAKHDKICPSITFSDAPTSQETNKDQTNETV